MHSSIITKIQGYGFDVYMRDSADTYLLFTDGTRIGYLQTERFGGLSLSTVHVPNVTTGTGFNIQRDIADFAKQTLELCFVHAPHWARESDRQSVTKWQNIDQYLKANSFNAAYKKLDPIAALNATVSA